jgi:hypothetical protein
VLSSETWEHKAGMKKIMKPVNRYSAVQLMIVLGALEKCAQAGRGNDWADADAVETIDQRIPRIQAELERREASK